MNDTSQSADGDERKIPKFFDLHNKGYQIVRDVVPKTIAATVRDFLAAELASLDPLFQTLGFRHDDAGAVKAIANIMDQGGETAKTHWHVLTGHFPLKTRLDVRLWPVLRSPKLLLLIREALSSNNIFMHMPPMVRYVLPGNGYAAVPAHQDISYNRHMTDFLTAWIPLTEIDGPSGGLATYEGSQNLPESNLEVGTSGWLQNVSTDRFRKHFCCPMRPGDCVIFGPNLIHESVPNTSDKTRLSFDMRFFSERHRSTRHVLDLQTWTVHEPESTL